ncbi:hypothetical protein Ddye_025282 [Dipteronia dyeriana]|uniref:Disease resistance RPP13-like protein 1 n=1 Tax=Dipteronia dyeriana TaxID=168575 RepID=A0AAD9TXG3_9ROSI|nr:hypothetical protein Ddye_025282 [Dipteronia dyeriana]
MTTFQFLPLEVGNALLSGVFPPLFHRLIPRILPRIVKDNEVRSELEKCLTKLAMIQAVLNDAEEKQWMNMAVRIWLDGLRDFAYDLEDMLDEYASKIIEDNLKTEHRTDFVSTMIDQLRTFWNNSNSISSIGDISKRLEELRERRSQLGLMERVAGETSSAAVWQIPPSTCLLTEPAVYGRDEDKRKILEMMSNDELNGANFRVISIVGMAGVGKTALAQVVYNDSTGGIHFDQKVWICVSNDFDVYRMSKAILESITHSSCYLKDLNEVHVQLKMAVTGRRFLLVLDDVWSKNYDLWKILISPFLTGARGSRIILTTRSIEVALTIRGPSDYYDLKLLSDDDCWSVFTNHAFENRDIAAHLNSEAFREKVVEKCGGLPLAARTLGGLLRSKLRNTEWEDILTSKLWDLPQESNILPVLKLSYNHLPSYLKICFAYCAILPKNYEFEEEELVLLWMAEGLILPSSTTTKHLIDIGHDYFHDLFSRSIFQKSSSDASKFVMHSLVNDLAQWVSGETSFRLEEELATPVQLKRFQRARHSSYSCCNFDGKNKFKVFDEVTDHLRTFLPILTHNLEYCFISNAVIFDLLPKFKKLRVLSLRKYYITKLPDSLGYLRYLRYLNLADTEVRSLPDSIILLFNLQILILRNCSRLLRLPRNVATLINLRHLNISGACLISEMPWGMSELKYLHTLSDFIVGTNSGSSLKDLKNLEFLSGELHISRLQNVTNSQELRQAILIDEKNLEVLTLDWGLELNLRNEIVEKDVLDMLRPHTNLRKLTIKHYGGIEFPSWVGNPYFSNMVDLELEDCKNCTSLPPLGLLGSLKYLRIKGMTGIRQTGPTFYGEGCSRPFRSLETFCLEDLPIWQRWNPVEDNEHVHSFCRLSELSIINCPELTGNLHRHIPS